MTAAGTTPSELAIDVVVPGPGYDDFVTLFAEYSFLPHNEGRSKDPEGEIAGLPGRYGAPHGGCLLARVGEEPVGCVVLAPLDPPAVCEMKRLYVREAARGYGAGRALVDAVMEEARRLGYSLMRLDTAPELLTAQALYDGMGFRRIAPYHDRYGDAICFEIELV